jgi:hypothetical protein
MCAITCKPIADGDHAHHYRDGGKAMSLMKIVALLLPLLLVSPAYARAGSHLVHHSGGSHSSSHAIHSHVGGGHVGSGIKVHSATSSTKQPSSLKAVGVQRDANGRIARSTKAKDEFKKSHPCPATGSSRGGCKGYVIDHVQALKHGGTDTPSNMQWQTTAAAKAKDKVE